jgi:hypothetical protein
VGHYNMGWRARFKREGPEVLCVACVQPMTEKRLWYVLSNHSVERTESVA